MQTIEHHTEEDNALKAARRRYMQTRLGKKSNREASERWREENAQYVSQYEHQESRREAKRRYAQARRKRTQEHTEFYLMIHVYTQFLRATLDTDALEGTDIFWPRYIFWMERDRRFTPVTRLNPTELPV